MERLRLQLEALEVQGLKRRLDAFESRSGVQVRYQGRDYIDFTSNDYLGFASEAFSSESPLFGSTGSRLLGGHYEAFEALEASLAKWLGVEAVLLFNSGYQANVGLLSALYGSGDLLLLDDYCHASLMDGMRLSGAKFMRFRHNDVADLEAKLHKHQGQFKTIAIVTESLFSMDGDTAPLEEYVRLKEQYKAELVVDEAHALGLFGPKGSGLVNFFSLEKKIDIRIGAFGKAFGSFGAFVAGTKILKEFLIQKARSFMFSTSLPLPIMIRNSAALAAIQNQGEKATEILTLSAHFRELLSAHKLTVLGESQIVPVVLGDEHRTLHAAEALREAGFWVKAVRYPTVPKNKARLRFSICAGHTAAHLEDLVDTLSKQR